MKLVELLKEIKINTPGRQILWGKDEQGRFTELIKIQGFKTTQEALDKINQLLGSKGEDDEYYMSYHHYITLINPRYAYLADDGQITFVKDLSEFGDSYTTEEDWRVVEWSKELPF